MTLQDALKIQAEQLDFYCGPLPPPDDVRWANRLPVGEINEMVPRGGDIEYALSLIRGVKYVDAGD
jgi:hypothetical protein